MSVQHRPSGDPKEVVVLKATCTTTETVVWPIDSRTGYPLHIVKWGGELYLPVESALQVAIGVYNGSAEWRAYPVYAGEANIHVNGPSRPDQCSTDHMWEVQPQDHVIVDAFLGRDTQPLTVMPYSQTYKLGKATPITNTRPNQLRIFERVQASGSMPRGKHSPSRHVSMKFDDVRGRDDNDTGVTYNPTAPLIARLWLESRRDMAGVLRSAKRPTTWSWAPVQSGWFKMSD